MGGKSVMFRPTEENQVVVDMEDWMSEPGSEVEFPSISGSQGLLKNKDDEIHEDPNFVMDFMKGLPQVRVPLPKFMRRKNKGGCSCGICCPIFILFIGGLCGTGYFLRKEPFMQKIIQILPGTESFDSEVFDSYPSESKRKPNRKSKRRSRRKLLNELFN